jgi:methylisocitrate lyase
LSALYSSTFAIKHTLQTLRETGTTKELKNNMITFQEFNDLVNLSKYNKLEKKYSF